MIPAVLIAQESSNLEKDAGRETFFEIQQQVRYLFPPLMVIKCERNSQSSSPNKDKPAPARAAANKAKSTAPTKKAGSTNNSSNSGMGEGEQRQTNGADSTENGVNGSEDVEMGEDTAGGPTSSFNTKKEREGDEKMTVVVPPTKGSRLSGQDKEGDVAMEGDEGDESQKPEVDPKVKAIQG